MAGGVLLMTLCAAILPVDVAMVAHGVTQIASNGSRFWLHRRHADLRGCGRYAAGAITAAAVAWLFLPRVSAAWVHVALGAVALGSILLRGRALPSFDHRWGAPACGAAVTLVQLVAGVSGPLLDAFFLRSPLPRHGVVATKAATQVMAHALKVAFWIALTRGDALTAGAPPWAYALLAAAAIAGTFLGARVLDRITDTGFRRATTIVIAVLGVGHLAWGVRMLAT